MNRRRFLTMAAGVGISTGAGCVGLPPRAGDAPASNPIPDGSTLRPDRHGFPPGICDQPIVPDSGIYAIVDPAFDTDWEDREIGLAYRHARGPPRLVADQTIIGVTWDGGARAYPLSILLHHEVVNDDAGGPVLVTYCPLCSSGMVASRQVAGNITQFAVTGQLWIPERIFAQASERRGTAFGASYAGGRSVAIKANGNLVLYDAATRSFWSQLLAAAICGPRSGRQLAIRPSTVATWDEWRSTHPDTDVLLPPPYSGTVEPGTVLGTG